MLGLTDTTPTAGALVCLEESCGVVRFCAPVGLDWGRGLWTNKAQETEDKGIDGCSGIRRGRTERMKPKWRKKGEDSLSLRRSALGGFPVGPLAQQNVAHRGHETFRKKPKVRISLRPSGRDGKYGAFPRSTAPRRRAVEGTVRTQDERCDRTSSVAVRVREVVQHRLRPGVTRCGGRF